MYLSPTMFTSIIWKESRVIQLYRWIISEFPSPWDVSIHLRLRDIAAKETETLCQNETVSVLFKATFCSPATTQKPLSPATNVTHIVSPSSHNTSPLADVRWRDQKLFRWDCCFFSVFSALLFIQSLLPAGLSGVQALSCCYRWLLFHFYCFVLG